MSQGNLADFIAAYPGNPAGASTSITDSKRGTIVFDTATGGAYRKMSVAGDNTLFLPLGAQIGWSEDFAAYDDTDQVAHLGVAGAAGGARTVTTNVQNMLYTASGNRYATWNIGQQDIGISLAASGLQVNGDDTDTDGLEIVTGAWGASGIPFVVGKTPAFYLKVKVTVGVVAGVTTLAVGFRKLATAVIAVASYVDYATIGLVAGDITIKSSTSGSSNSTDISTDTTDNLADATAATFEVYVSAAGVVTYKVNGSAPTTVAAYTFPDGTMVVPFFHFVQGATTTDSVIIGSWEQGLQ